MRKILDALHPTREQSKFRPSVFYSTADSPAKTDADTNLHQFSRIFCLGRHPNSCKFVTIRESTAKRDPDTNLRELSRMFSLG